MNIDPLDERLRSHDVLDQHLVALCALDSSLMSVVERCETVPLRASTPGFEGLARIVVGQLLSVQSAAAIWKRFEAKLGDVVARRFTEYSFEDFQGVGLSNAKFATLKNVARAELEGALDYQTIAQMDVDAALASLLYHKGIGPWTAEVYLTFCVGHPDIFPAGDLALRKIVAHHMELDATPSIKETREYTQHWSPYRGTAARLMWRYYAVVKNQEGILL